MKKRIISMMLLTAMLLGCMTGCGEEKKTPDNIEDAINSMSDEELESAIIEGADKIDSENTNIEDITEQPEEIVYKPSQEIIDADFKSLLVQLNNDVFVQGGYITVAELVAEYSDRYTFEYKDGSYDERKDYLIEYKIGDTKEWYNMYAIRMTPIYGNEQHQILAYIANLTSPNEKITLDQAHVLYVQEGGVEKPGSWASHYYTPLWIPKGFASEVCDGIYKKEGVFTSADENIMIKDFLKYLESQGFTEYVAPSNFGTQTSKLDYDMTYIPTRYRNGYSIYVAGKANASGLRPLFCHTFTFSDDTDKLDEVTSSFIGLFE